MRRKVHDDGLGAAGAERLDRFDRVQLAEVIRVCRTARTLSDASRTLFAITRLERKTANDADRLQKYLARFGTAWAACRAGAQERTRAVNYPAVPLCSPTNCCMPSMAPFSART